MKFVLCHRMPISAREDVVPLNRRVFSTSRTSFITLGKHISHYLAMVVLATALLLLGTSFVLGGTTSSPPAHASGEKSRMRWHFQPIPEGDLYPVYIADPHHSSISVQLISFERTEIFDSGNNRFGLKLGGRFGLFRVHPADSPERGLQVGIEAGFIGQFDNDNSQDNIGWDGIYGLLFSLRANEVLALKFGALHTSSHIGDEYAERTGRRRINYTREEFLVGVSGEISERWRIYGEAAYGYRLRTKTVQKPGRVQLGVEYESSPVLWKDRVGWYAAADGSAYEERNWDINFSVQTGFAMRNNERTWRLGVEYYDGRSVMGEFFQDDERSIALGLWLSL
ncbi:MAG: DUF1207 domain-containing protein [Nitrospiria bacterium]